MFTDNQHFNVAPLFASPNLRLYRFVLPAIALNANLHFLVQFSVIASCETLIDTLPLCVGFNCDEWMLLWLFIKQFFHRMMFNAQQNGKYTSDND